MSAPAPSAGAGPGLDAPARDGASARHGGEGAHRTIRVALLGNPNTGKTTLFNALTGLRHHTSNFPGTTQDARVGSLREAHGERIEIVDLPGVYSLGLEQIEAALCRAVLRGEVALRGAGAGGATGPDGAIVVLDATNLARNLTLVGEVLATGVPVVAAVNMMDRAKRDGLVIDAQALARELGCAVELVCARTGSGLERIPSAVVVAVRGQEAPSPVGAAHRPPLPQGGEGFGERGPVGAALRHPLPKNPQPRRPLPQGEEGGEGFRSASSDEDAALAQWARAVASRVTRREGGLVEGPTARRRKTDSADLALTHPALGLAAFALVMTGLFWAIFSLAKLPMDWIDGVFGALSGAMRDALPAGYLADLLADGVVAGVGATLVFLPQIALLFFLIALLEDSGYLARAAFVADRLMRPFGLSGHAFVPMLSSHACALPGIMACRGIPDPKERLAAILTAPFMSCTARIPVYVLLVSLLFPGKPMLQALAFTGCYVVGAGAGLLSALIARRTVAKGAARPMALELPAYKAPSARAAMITAYDRAMVFLKQAGTNILAICVILWWLGAFPRIPPPADAVALRGQAAAVAPGEPLAAEALIAQADRLEAREQSRRSFMGRLGSALEPVVAPLGYDRQLAVGVLASFAAREVFVSTMSVVVSGEDASDAAGVTERLANAKRDDGVTPVFTPAVAWSLLVYYILAMQCLPTLAVTAREAGGVKWALVQLAWMCGLAYAAAFVVFRVASAMGG